jgi:hypothetical protein
VILKTQVHRYELVVRAHILVWNMDHFSIHNTTLIFTLFFVAHAFIFISVNTCGARSGWIEDSFALPRGTAD